MLQSRVYGKFRFKERRVTMARRRIILGSSICLLIAVFVGQSLSQARKPNRTSDSLEQSNRMRQMSPEERRREFEKRRREYKERAAQRREQRRVERENKLRQVRKEAGKRSDESIKQALGATEEQWKVIEPKFKKVRTIMHEARVSIAPVSYAAGGSSSGGGKSSYREGTGRYGGAAGGSASAGGSAGAGGSGGVGGRWTPLKDTNSEETRSWNQSGWKWLRPSANKSPGKLTKGERICEELLDLLQDKGANPEAIRQRVDALRNIREKAERQLVKARQELHNVLTPRQEATLVLMGWLD